MPQTIAARTDAAIKMLTLTLIASCDSQDGRLAEYARRATEQQVLQNERMAQQSEAIVKQSHEITAAAQQLVEQDAAARRELIQAQENLQQQSHAERVSLDGQRQKLDTERTAAANAAVRDPVIAQAIVSGGLILGALLPLLITLYALRRLPDQTPVEELLGDALLQSAVGGQRALEFERCEPSLPSVASGESPDDQSRPG